MDEHTRPYVITKNSRSEESDNLQHTLSFDQQAVDWEVRTYPTIYNAVRGACVPSSLTASLLPRQDKTVPVSYFL